MAASAFAQLAAVFWEIFGTVTPVDGYPEVDSGKPGSPVMYRFVTLGEFTLWGSLKGSRSRFHMIIERPGYPIYVVTKAKAFARVEGDVAGVNGEMAGITILLDRSGALHLTLSALWRAVPAAAA